jgi:hypothetical protein
MAVGMLGGWAEKRLCCWVGRHGCILITIFLEQFCDFEGNMANGTLLFQIQKPEGELPE